MVDLWNDESPKLYRVTVTADTNDADYVTQVTDVTQNGMDTIKRILEIIPRNRYDGIEWFNQVAERYKELRFNDQYRDLIMADGTLCMDDLEWFQDECVPNGDEEYGIHTIVSVKYTDAVPEIKLL